MDGINSQLVAKANVMGAARRMVVKIGSSVLSDGAGLHRPRLSYVCARRDLAERWSAEPLEGEVAH